MKKINKILSLISCLFLTSCNNSNDIESYNYKEEENRIIVKDFTLDDARNCVRTYRYVNNYKFSSYYGIDIYYYLGKGTTELGNIILMGDYDPYNPLHETYKPLTNEKIGDYDFEWTKVSKNLRCAHNPVFIGSDFVCTLSEAYKLNYINDNELKNIKDIFDNKLDEYKVFMRFESYNSL